MTDQHVMRPLRGRCRPVIGGCAAALLAAATLSGCGSSASPGATARSYLADWARRDWSAMRSLVAAPPPDFASVSATALTDLSVRRASYAPGTLRTDGARAVGAGLGAACDLRHRHGHHPDRAPAGPALGKVARSLDAGHDRAAAAGLAASCCCRRPGRRGPRSWAPRGAADGAGPDGDDRRRRAADQAPRLARHRAGGRGRPRPRPAARSPRPKPGPPGSSPSSPSRWRGTSS